MTNQNLVPESEAYRILEVRPTYLGQTQVIVELPNGYRASVVGGPVTVARYGHSYGIEEVGIMNSQGTLIYGTPVEPHDAVRRYGSVEEIPAILDEIAALDPRITYPTGYQYVQSLLDDEDED